MSDEATKGAGEPSMEEILASIRQIINQNDPPAGATTATAETEVLELTDIIEEEEETAVEEPTPEPEPAAPEPSLEEIAATFAPPAPEPTPAPEPAPVVAPAEPTGDELISGNAATAASAALSNLASTLVQEKMEHSLPMGNGMRTLESMVVEAMKPLLKEWLDENLAGIVERIVQAEVEKLTKRLGG